MYGFTKRAVVSGICGFVATGCGAIATGLSTADGICAVGDFVSPAVLPFTICAILFGVIAFASRQKTEIAPKKRAQKSVERLVEALRGILAAWYKLAREGFWHRHVMKRARQLAEAGRDAELKALLFEQEKGP